MGEVNEKEIYEPTWWGLYPATDTEPAHISLHSCGPLNCFDCKLGLSPETYAKMVEDGIKTGKPFNIIVDEAVDWTPELTEEKEDDDHRILGPIIFRKDN